MDLDKAYLELNVSSREELIFKLKELVKYFTKASTTVDAQTGDLIDLVEDGKVNTIQIMESHIS